MRIVGVLAAVAGGLVTTQPEPSTTTQTDPAATAEADPEGQEQTDPTGGYPTDADPAQPETRGAEPSVTPTSGPAGTRVTVDLGDTSCSDVDVLWDRAPFDTTEQPGAVTFTVPQDAAPGVHPVDVTCGGSPLLSSSFTVRPSPTTTAAATPTSRPDATSSPTTSVPRVPETIEECESQANEALARLVYEPERRMVVHHSYDVQAALSLDELPSDVTFESPTTIVEIPDARCTVEAHLTGSDFAITPEEPRPQSFIGTRTLVWEWQVQPRRVDDDLELTLRLQAQVVEGGRTVPGRTILHESAIDVAAEPQSAWDRLVEWLRDVFGHPMVPVVVVPAAGAASAYLWRRMGPKKPSAPAPGPGDDRGPRPA